MNFNILKMQVRKSENEKFIDHQYRERGARAYIQTVIRERADCKCYPNQ